MSLFHYDYEYEYKDPEVKTRASERERVKSKRLLLWHVSVSNEKWKIFNPMLLKFETLRESRMLYVTFSNGP